MKEPDSRFHGNDGTIESINRLYSREGVSFMQDIDEELTFAGSVCSGEADACEKFMDEYTGLVLSKVSALMKTHCSYPARERACSLIVLNKQRRGVRYFPVEQCDECMDSYVWFFEFLKNKIKAYKGTNDCSLKTFVWSIINSRSTYIEWLRWKYGRAY
ncbi:MAG: hypothetical protein ABSB95_07205 [Dissulfurispiraceae bacterium]